MTVDSLIPEKHVVRVINSTIDKMDLEPLFAKYPGGGQSSFHPIMMTKLLVYAYADKIFSCRRIEWGLHCIAHNMRKIALMMDETYNIPHSEIVYTT